MNPTLDHALAAYTLVSNELLPAGAITHQQAHTIVNALLQLMIERNALRGSIVRMEEAQCRAQRRRDRELDRQLGPDPRLT